MSGANSSERSRTVLETWQEFWNTRPVRPRVGGKLGGVSAAIGLRYGVDPVLIRIAFVVGAFYGGSGLALYLIGWMLLPKQDESGVGFKSTSAKLIVLLAIPLFPVLFWVTDVPGLFGITLGLVALFLLQRNLGHRAPEYGVAGFDTTSQQPAASQAPPVPPHPTVSPAQPDPGQSSRGQSSPGQQGADEPDTDQFRTSEARSEASLATGQDRPATYPVQTSQQGITRPTDSAETSEAETEHLASDPSPNPAQAFDAQPWSPLDTSSEPPDPGAPLPSAAPESPRARRGWLSFGTVALAVLVGMLTFAANQSATYAGAAALAVLGGGMLFGAFLRAGRGLIAVAVPVAAVTIMFATLSLHGPWNISQQVVTPTTLESVRPDYTASAGDITLNLGQLALTDGQELRTAANLKVGNIHVQVPPDVDITTTCSADFGRVDCFAGERTGEDPSSTTTDFAADGPGGGHIVLDLRAGTGNVEVNRG